MPGLSGGIAFDLKRPIAYVSGLPAPRGYTQTRPLPASVPGRQGDVIHVLRYNRRTGRARRAGLIEVPPPAGTLPPQNFPPTNGKPYSWPRDVAVSPDGRTLLVALNLAHQAAIVDTRSGAVRYVATGRYPYGAAILRDGRRGLVSNEADGTVSVIDLERGTETAEIRVGPHLSHPEGIAVDPKRPLAYVAVTHQDLIAVIDTARLEVRRTLSVERPAGIGTGPVQLSVTADGCRLLSANSGEDAIAVFALSAGRRCEPRATRSGNPAAREGLAARILAHEARTRLELAESERAERAEVLGEEAEERAEEALRRRPVQARGRKWQLLGRIPVASYPVAVFATPQPPSSRRLVWLTAKGLGVGPNQARRGQRIPEDSGSATAGAPERFRFRYLPENVFGMSGVMRFPSAARLARLTPRASRQIRPVNGQRPPRGTPIRSGGPIEHVFYVVRENRTYDQILGDLRRGDGDPKLTLFGRSITPNAHALARRFGILDHVYANSEASIDGHFWTSAAAVSDYVVKNWHQNYAGRGRPYDFGVYAVTWPSQRFLFDRAERQGISWFNYGEAIAGTVPLPDLDRTNEENAEVVAKFAKSDLGPLAPGPQLDPPAPCYSNDASSGGENVITGQEVFDSSRPPGANPLTTESRFQCFRARFRQQLAADAVPAFSYISLPNDHTVGTTPGGRTPRAMIAENDLALGEIVDEISHSPIWPRSLILVIEDDSQDGLDHVDAHRIPALSISPYSRRGAAVHTRYDFLSFIRTLEIVVGMRPLNLFDALAVPMYDAFDGNPSDNDEPYDAIVPNVNLLERNTAQTPGAALSRRLPLHFTDRTPQRLLDRILWQYTHGRGSEPPPPGPNASGLDEELWWRHGTPSRAELMREVRELLGVTKTEQERAFDDD
jgi:YVTN family beta-propeller protein